MNLATRLYAFFDRLIRRASGQDEHAQAWGDIPSRPDMRGVRGGGERNSHAQKVTHE